MQASKQSEVDIKYPKNSELSESIIIPPSQSQEQASQISYLTQENEDLKMYLNKVSEELINKENENK